jgi:hypothetical protein
MWAHVIQEATRAYTMSSLRAAHMMAAPVRSDSRDPDGVCFYSLWVCLMMPHHTLGRVWLSRRPFLHGWRNEVVR